MNLITANIRKIAQDLCHISNQKYWEDKLKDKYDLTVEWCSEVYDKHLLIRQIFNIFKPVPPALIKDCGVSKLIIDNTMGPNREFFPNHGFYRESDHTVTLNADIFYHPDQPDDFFDHRGYFLTRAVQTLYHEYGHAYDACHQNISLKPAWMSLSGWSRDYKPGLKQLRIKEEGFPEIIGEYYYNSKAEFTRFYARRNPYDDFADSFSFYIGNLKTKIPANKRKFLDSLLIIIQKNIK
jgi:hypothetical protein